ncbi:MAG: aminotransferase class III-fold pyridoxal phosphate-dependent enzyme, partial [Deltaproteobacteria bacterium]|nr:aminotransferase class III-fold pyridoxal phosphate-dependent enzyme [Deltaproteobacteria bacterium]
GMLCGKRIEEVEKNVFVEASRLNSTFGGNIVDMVRVTKILEVIHRDKLLHNAAHVGLYLLEQLRELEKDFEEVTNARGLGLMCAIDLPTPEARDRVRQSCYDKGMIILSCGTRSIRFRPALTVTTKEIGVAIDILRTSVRARIRDARPHDNCP